MIGIDSNSIEVMSKVIAGRTLLCRLVGDTYVMSGASTGEHRLCRDFTPDERLKAHWDGYGARMEEDETAADEAPASVTPVVPAKRPAKAQKAREYVVTLRYEYPCWDEKDGIAFEAVAAFSKRDAIANVRRQADNAGLTGSGHGRMWFKAVEVE